MTAHPALTPAVPDDFGLPPCYAAAGLSACAEPLSTDVELCRRHAEIQRELGRRPTVVFTGLTDHPGMRVLGHPYPRPVLMAALGVEDADWCAELTRRLSGPALGRRPGDASHWSEVKGFGDLPICRHRPGDAGPYVTAGVVVTTRPDGGGANLGVYRIQVVSGREARIFIDPRTDGHRNLRQWHADGDPMPISVFLGADPVFALVAASRLPAEGDDYEVASRLLGRVVEVAAGTGGVPVPTCATHVISGRVLARTAEEGPFGEFKGYYVDARQSNVLEVDSVLAVPGSPFPTIVAGAETGLTLMSVQNEFLMFAHLTEQGFPVRSVRYPHAARAEFLTLIETPEPTAELLAAAMAFDVRTKVVICGQDLRDMWQAVATHGFITRAEAYFRKGLVEGERIGLVLTIAPTGRPVEY